MLKPNQDPPGIIRFNWLPGFKLNVCLVLDQYCKWHAGLALLGVLCLSIWTTPHQSFLVAMLLGFLWEVGDGFKKGWWTKEAKAAPKWKRLIFYADGFSWSDLVIFDLIGCILGRVVIFLIGTLCQ